MSRVIALGQRYRGDDAVGLVVGERLQARGVRVAFRDDAALLVDDLASSEPVVLVDAVVGSGAPGEVVVLDGYALPLETARPVSSHGMSVGDAIDLAVALHGEACAPWLAIVGICIAPPTGTLEGLSAEVDAAVEAAERRVLTLLEES